MKTTPVSLLFILIVLAFCPTALNAQTPPSVAQIKKDLMNPGVIEIIIRGNGSFDKFAERGAIVNEYYRSVTVRRKTEKPGVTVDVLGDVVYRLVGGRWVYRTMRLAENRYGGIANPTAPEINEVLRKAQVRDIINGYNSLIGEFESMRISPDPNWEWHTPNSVSFNVVAVFREIYGGGSYQGEASPTLRPGYQFVDKVEAVLRIRLYRNAEKEPWQRLMTSRFGKNVKIKNSKGESVYAERMLERNEYPSAQVDRMPRATRVPLVE